MSIAQTPANLFGPAAPHIAFFYGEHYLGETRGHPGSVEGIEAARSRLLNSIELLDAAERYCVKSKRYRLLNATHAKVYCGDIVVELGARLVCKAA